MILTNLRIKNFRNLESLSYVPCAQMNVFLGDNAQGKTSLLEAIFLMGNGSSFRTGTDKDLMRYDTEGYKIFSEYTVDNRVMTALLEYDAINNKKIIQINHKTVNFKNKDLLKFVVFTPDDLSIIKGNPGKRRRFLDFILRQVSSTYSLQLENYYRILKKRNDWLKSDRQDPQVAAIVNDVFFDNAVKIILSRIQLVSILDEYLQTVYDKLSDQPSLPVKLRYALSFPLTGSATKYETIREAMEKQAAELLPVERKRKKCLLGPHLDDLNFYLDHRLAKLFASQGQQRSMVVALKLAEVYTHYLLRESYPIFLLDEVLSELDEQRKKKLIDYLTGLPCQSFLTAVSLDRHSVDRSHCQIQEVRSGILS